MIAKTTLVAAAATVANAMLSSQQDAMLTAQQPQQPDQVAELAKELVNGSATVDVVRSYPGVSFIAETWTQNADGEVSHNVTVDENTAASYAQMLEAAYEAEKLKAIE